MPRWLVLTIDLGFLATFAVLVGLPIATVAIAFELWSPALGPARWLLLPLLALAALLLLLAEVAVLHRILPRASPGTHRVPSLPVLGWLLRFWLQRVVAQPAWSQILVGSSILRWIAFRALGCRLPFTTMMSSDAAISEAYLVTVGRGVLLGTQSSVLAHLFVGDTLVLAPVTIENDAQIYASAMIGPGCRIGARAIVGAGVMLGPGTTLGAGASLGMGVRAVRDVTLGEGARVGPGATLLRGAIVAPGEVVPAGAVRGPPASAQVEGGNIRDSAQPPPGAPTATPDPT